MQCKHCGCEWTAAKNYRSLINCPFCKEVLFTQTKMPEGTALGEVLKVIFEHHGAEILLEKRRCMALLRDYAPRMHTERQALSDALDKEIAGYFIDPPEEEQDANVFRARAALETLPEETEDLVIEALVYALGWEKEAPAVPAPDAGPRRKLYPNGDVYEGDVDIIPDGRGSMEYQNGDRYEGDWRAGVPCGQGKLVKKNGAVYEGSWIDGKYNGQGKMVWPWGQVYEGNWENGRINGYGKLTKPDGEVQEGHFVNGILS